MRTMLAVIAGAVAWMAVATLCNLALRAAWPAYGAAEPAFTFTLPMLAARLAMGAAATVASGLVVVQVAKAGRQAAWAMGVLLLALFVPQHIVLFAKFPLWYHAIFLFSLLPLTLAGARLGGMKPSASGQKRP